MDELFAGPMPVIAILRGVKPDEVVAIGHVLIEHGIATIEVPLNSPDPFASIGRLADAFGETALIGAGTVMTVEDVSRAALGGARFIVSPNIDPDVIMATKRSGLASLPGCFTATEAFAALAAGADGLKIFPADIGGPGLIAGLRAVLPRDTPLCAVGGIGPDELEAFCAAGCRGFGIGSALYAPGDDVAAVTAKAAAVVEAARRLVTRRERP